jgi:dTDP-glucose 4,6-dehydratase
MQKVVFITGCLGFIGSHITKACLEKGWFVHGVDSMTYAANLARLPEFQHYKNFQWVPSDINKLLLISDCDAVINTAAETHVDNSISNSATFIDSNIYGVYNLLDLIRNSPRQKPLLLHFSTDEVYGDIIDGSHLEGDRLNPSNPYAATKAAAEMLILAWKRTYNIDYTIVRPTNNYGCWQNSEKLIPQICRSVIQNRKFPLHNHGTPRRTWLHVEDTTDAIVHIVENDLRNRIFNIGGDYEDSNLNVAKKVVKCLTGDEDIAPYCDFSFKRVGQDVRYSVNPTAIIKIGWANLRHFDEELPKIVEHYKERFKS